MVKPLDTLISSTRSLKLNEDLTYASSDQHLPEQPPFSANQCRLRCIDHLTSDLLFGNNRVIPEKPGLQNDIACSDCIALWGAHIKRSKMANELELAEEMSNSSPEQAMELLSSIGNTLSEFSYQILSFFAKNCFFSMPVLQNELLFYSFDQ